MQNIKYCPKCNQSSKENISFCPFDGTQLIEMQPAQNQPIQTTVTTPPQAVSPSLPENTKKEMSPLMTGCLALVIVPIIFLVVMGIFWSRPLPEDSISKNATSNSDTNVTQTASAKPTPSPALSSLSPKENLEAGRKALSQGDLGTARTHLTAIPKGASEYASAKQLLTKVEAREKRKAIEDELADVRGSEAEVENTLNKTEDMEGSIGKTIYANALKRKGELQLRRIQLERKLKGMP